MGILLEEWMAFYEGALSGKPAELKELSIQYADFCHVAEGMAKKKKI